jgi:hypothetical protein
MNEKYMRGYGGARRLAVIREAPVSDMTKMLSEIESGYSNRSR